MQNPVFFVFTLLLLGALQGWNVSAQTPLVCQKPPELAETEKIADGIANIVDSALKLAGTAMQDPEVRAPFTDCVDKVMTALKNGFAQPDVCDAIANSIADPLAVIPVVGECISSIIKTPIKEGCQALKIAKGC